MISTNLNGCDPERLLLLLKNRASVDDEANIASHIEGCASCQAALEEMAADNHEWDAVRQSYTANMVSYKQELDTKEIGVKPADLAEGPAAKFEFFKPSPDPTKLGLLGQIEIVSVIGRGGMGIVFKGYDPSLKRLVAVKVLSPEHAVGGTARARFRREAESIAAVVDEHVVPIHSVQAEHNPPYLVMTFVPGCCLQEKLEIEGFLGVPEILRIGQQIAAGLASAHAKGIVHLDIKPANVLLEDGLDRVKITDFGLARSVDDVMLTRLGGVSGTPQFMSPEQANGDKVDFRSDLFSLGITLYAMGTGNLPFNGNGSLSVMNQICETMPPSMRGLNREIPVWLDNLVFRLLEKSPDNRYQSASAVADLLEKCLAHVQQPSLVDLPEGLDKSLKRRRGSSTSSIRRKFVGLLTATSVIITLLFGLWASGLFDQKRPVEGEQPVAAKTESPDATLKEAKQNDSVRVYWLPGQVQPGQNQIFSFGQGVIKGHIFTRTLPDGRVHVTVAGISTDDRIQIDRVSVTLIDADGNEVPASFQFANSMIETPFGKPSVRTIGFAQRTKGRLVSPAVIRLVVETPAEQKPD